MSYFSSLEGETEIYTELSELSPMELRPKQGLKFLSSFLRLQPPGDPGWVLFPGGSLPQQGKESRICRSSSWRQSPEGGGWWIGVGTCLKLDLFPSILLLGQEAPCEAPCKALTLLILFPPGEFSHREAGKVSSVS